MTGPRTPGLQETVVPIPRPAPTGCREQRVRGRPRECADVVRCVSLVVVAMIDAVRAQPSALPFARDLLHAVDLDKPLRAMTGCAHDAPANTRLAGSRVHDSHVAGSATRRRSGPTKRESPAAQPESSCSPEAGRGACISLDRDVCPGPTRARPARKRRPGCGTAGNVEASACTERYLGELNPGA